MKKPLLVGFALALLVPTSRAAAASLGVNNALIMENVSPSRTITEVVTVTSDSAVPVGAAVKGFGQSLDGGFLAIDPDTNPDTARPWISVSPASFVLSPGVAQAVTVTIAVPAQLDPGTKYAMLVFMQGDSADTGAGNVGMRVSISVPVVLTSTTGPLIRTGAITGAQLGNVARNAPIQLDTIFRNTGNTHFRAKSQLQVFDAAGTVVRTVTGDPTFTSVIPTYERELLLDVTALGALPGGTYTYRDQVLLEDGTALDAVSGKFTLLPAVCPDWDVNCDHVVGLADIGQITRVWGQTGEPGWIRADVNKDGVIDAGDIALVGAHWGETW